MSWWLGSYSWSLAVLGGVVLVLVLVPWSRRFLLARFWCLFTRHRLQRVFWELRLHTRAGHLPWVLWTHADHGRGAVLGAVPARHLRR